MIETHTPQIAKPTNSKDESTPESHNRVLQDLYRTFTAKFSKLGRPFSQTNFLLIYTDNLNTQHFCIFLFFYYPSFGLPVVIFWIPLLQIICWPLSWNLHSPKPWPFSQTFHNLDEKWHFLQIFQNHECKRTRTSIQNAIFPKLSRTLIQRPFPPNFPGPSSKRPFSTNFPRPQPKRPFTKL